MSNPFSLHALSMASRSVTPEGLALVGAHILRASACARQMPRSRRNSANGSGWSSTRMSRSGVLFRRQQHRRRLLPRLSPPMPWPASSAASRRSGSASSPCLPWHRTMASNVASTTAGPASILPATDMWTPVRSPHQATHWRSVQAAARPCRSAACTWPHGGLRPSPARPRWPPRGRSRGRCGRGSPDPDSGWSTTASRRRRPPSVGTGSWRRPQRRRW